MPLSLLVDANVPAPVIAALREAGHDVAWVSELGSGSSDDQVLSLAQSTNRILLTLDKDFGELVFLRRLPATAGVILVRLITTNPQDLATLLRRVLAEHSDWQGQFSVIGPGGIRSASLPTQPSSEP